MNRPLESLAKLGRRIDFSGSLLKFLAGLALDRLGLVLGQNFSLPLQQHGQQRVNARPQASDLTGIEVNGPRQLLIRQPAGIAEHQHVFHRRRHQIGRRLRRPRQIDRVVLLVRVDDAAEGVAIGHDDHSTKTRSRPAARVPRLGARSVSIPWVGE